MVVLIRNIQARVAIMENEVMKYMHIIIWGSILTSFNINLLHSRFVEAFTEPFVVGYIEK